MKLVFVLFVVFLNGCFGCLESEKTALLQIKASIDRMKHSYAYLESWVEDGSDCCQWESIECNTSSGRVIGISLNATRFTDYYEDWYLNVSLFLPFKDLKKLFLSSNGIVGCLENEGFERLKFSNLEVLDLSGNLLNDSKIVSSMFEISSIKYLNLHFNKLVGSTPINGFKRSSRLSNLEYLDLSFNDALGNSILSYLGGLSSLKTLNLANSGFKGPIPIQELFSSTKLMNLDLSINNIESFLPNQGLETLHQFNNLEVLDLRDNLLNNNILLSLRMFPLLKILYMQNNKLNGSVQIEEFGGLTNLEELDLSENEIKEFVGPPGSNEVLCIVYLSFNIYIYIYSKSSTTKLANDVVLTGWHKMKELKILFLNANKFEGKFPSFLGNMKTLQGLDISDNQFSGNIASSSLTNLTNLQYLFLGNNSFQIPISFSSFMNYSKLKVLLCDSNELLIDSGFQTWSPKFQLMIFTLSNCATENFSTILPNFLYYQFDLRIVDLSQSNFEGLFPTWLFHNNTGLQEIQLYNNFFTGPFLLPSISSSNLEILDGSNNNFSGRIPTNMSLVFPSLYHLNMSSNKFYGEIPQDFSNFTSLGTLDLSRNNLSGELPERGMHISYLKLSNNNLNGEIFHRFFNFTLLKNLHLNSNKLVGKIPDLSFATDLNALDLSDNNFSGELPRWIGNTRLLGISLSNNKIEGMIPIEFCKLDSLFFLDLSGNEISGSVPSCFSPHGIKHVHLNNNRLSGEVTRAFYNNTSLVTLDLSHNNLVGSIPHWFGDLSSLSVLIMSYNHFRGQIPVQICNLHKLRIMDLSGNKISGHIPLCLSTLTLEAGDANSENMHDFSGRFMVSVPFLSSFPENLPSPDKYIARGYARRIDLFDEVEFRTKGISYSYKGKILSFMSGIDLSSNQLTGEIPLQIGNLSEIRALNLSHNSLTGTIPSTFSKLRQIESLDLSYNNLGGQLPPELTSLSSLAVFSVAHNNLSGKTPEFKGQFGTFQKDSYEGNPLLCGPPLDKSCIQTENHSPPATNASDDEGGIDMDMFAVSFAVSYIIVLLSIAAVLYINSYWRQVWFSFIGEFIHTCHYFVARKFHKLLNVRRM